MQRTVSTYHFLNAATGAAGAASTASSALGPGADLQLVQLADVGFTLQLKIPHLIFMFLMLSHSLILLPLFFLRSKL